MMGENAFLSPKLDYACYVGWHCFCEPDRGAPMNRDFQLALPRF